MGIAVRPKRPAARDSEVRQLFWYSKRVNPRHSELKVQVGRTFRKRSTIFGTSEASSSISS